ncbi:tryptophan halogenase family protein [Colwellia sp. MEBiC06753]
MQQEIKHIVIVGGGSAGWLTAGIIAAKHCSNAPDSVKVTLIESPNIATVGVGEGTWPSMRSTLHAMGISEAEFIIECDASFKQASKFENWITGQQDSYYHPFTQPTGFFEINIANYWANLKNEAELSFADATTPQSHICQLGLAPKQSTTPEYSFINNYGYHLDAGKFGAFLQKHCTKTLGVHHILDDVIKINNAENTDISSLTTAKHGELTGDLFIDCTGFKSLLLGEHYGVGFNDVDHILFNDRALAVQVPYQDADSAIASHTISNAQDSGWIWDIGLQSRRGVGHVYSSQHTSDEQAQQALANYIEKTSHLSAELITDNLDFRAIRIRPGYREKFWQNNCVAIGMSAGFIEPLEASALALIELSAKMVAEQLPANRAVMNITAKRFNQKFNHRWQRIIEFLKLHYVLSKRQDSDYWLDNKRNASIPEHLQELLSLWQYQTPYHFDSHYTEELFPAASFQFVLYGMGFTTQVPPHLVNQQQQHSARQYLNENARQTQQMIKALESNRAVINKIKEFGLARRQ